MIENCRGTGPASRLVCVMALMLCGPCFAAPLVLSRNGAYVAVEPYAPNIVRITIATDAAAAAAPPGYGFIAASAQHAFEHSESAGGDDLRSSALRLHVDAPPPPAVPSSGERYFAPSLPPVGLEIRNARGAPVLSMTGWQMAPHTVNGEATFQVGASFDAPAGEHFYGLGQNQEGILDLRGRTIDCRHFYDEPHGETVCIPFMVSSRGYGIVWDNPSDTHVYPGVNGRTLWESEVGERVSFFVIVGDDADAVYAGYAKLTGRTPLPPKAAFGLIQSKARYASQQEILDVAHTYRAKGYPLDIMVIDWFYWTRMGQLDIDPAQFPDPDRMNRDLHALGMRSLISVWPRFERDSRYFNELDAKGFFLKDKDGKTQDGLPFRADRAGALIDATNGQALDWFFTHVRDNILSHGFDYLWLDETEPDLVPDGFLFSIGSGNRYHNIFPLLYVGGMSRHVRAYRPDRRVLILARAAYLGSQRTGAIFWSSDIDPSWEALKRQIPTGLNMTASGIAYWGNDIGGWQPLPQRGSATHPLLIDPSDARDVVGGDDDYPELFTRWFEYGTFLPTLRVHGERKHTEIWAYGKQAEAILARYDRLRYQLIPYIYSLARHTYESGAPFMRALWMDFPGDARVSTIGDEYMFGPDFLVAPVTSQGQTRKQVYLPAGADWYDYWTNERLSGGRTVTADAPIDRIPVFVRAGSILPMGAVVPNTATPQDIERIRVYPGRDADFDLYDDDGVSYGYQRGGGRVTHLHWNDATHHLGASGSEKILRRPAEALLEVMGAH
ncbi:MAG TPA: glycoside hydrolase family 31 protein [Steroidobacteraceae bacterium]|nr:glycoside hydrolase family 31 protein [Steroidobacteraceae bacterium]